LDGKPVRARPVGMWARAVKWARRRPAAALLAATLLITLAAAGGAGVWLRQQQQDRQAAKAQREGHARQAVEAALRRAGDLRKEERWPEALLILTDAATHLAEADDLSLQQRLRQAQSDCQIAAMLGGARESYPRKSDGTTDYPQWAAEFQKA